MNKVNLENIISVENLLLAWSEFLTGKRSRKENSSTKNGGETLSFGNHDAMPVLAVPDVVIREAVDVHLETIVVVDVHVSNEELYDKPSISLPTQAQFNVRGRAVFYPRLRSLQAYRTNFYVFCFKKEFTLSQEKIQRNSQIDF